MKNHDVAVEAAKAAPAISVGGLTLFGYPLNEVVLMLTLIYTIFLLIDKLPTVFQRFRELWHFLRGTHNDRKC